VELYKYTMLVSRLCQKILVERLDKYPSPIGSGNLSSLSTSIFWQRPLTSMVYFYKIQYYNCFC